MPKEDLYSILGVARTSEQWLIQRKYRALMRRYHPDAGTEPNTAEAQRINEAYGVLGDPEKRRRYDAAADTAEATAQRQTAFSAPELKRTDAPESRDKPVRSPALSDAGIVLWLLAFGFALIALLYLQR
jgi:DnaJ-class molecular chaperone